MEGYIFKYEIPITDEIIAMEIPDNYALCHVGQQDGKLFMWCAVDIHAKLVKRRFKIVGTGHKIVGIESLFFLRTIQMPNGLVWHLFEVSGL
ncbi:hypothetical protein UFOVP685_56 [uncultured Caudovirales phage]|uniref:DUF7352 domain-containing protein n=1 Tax=uncultured Caudovirales phage TaxID=2100421 RepID=A0A6J5NGR6_9CAUD|nr:hypothetical protein UFOVP590_28 [uncultured Caudovirales phage]CAB4157912.1 hypothetical protein UFOVP685_56 [uncultured Caudovirales phage]CAB5225633.1 hypothetical protein UFOVP750_57 [uncultured Caudovirales phage]